MPRIMRQDMNRLRQEARGVPGGRAGQSAPAPATMPGAARAVTTPSPAALSQASQMAQQAQQPQRIAGAPQMQREEDRPAEFTSSPGILPPGFAPPSIVPGPNAPRDIRNETGFTGAGPGVIGNGVPTGPIDYVPGMEPPPPEQDPVNLDDLAGDTMGKIYEGILDILNQGGRDTDAEKAALEASMQNALSQQMVDARARMGAMGMGMSGAQVNLEGNLQQQGALDQALAMANIDAAARDEQLARLGAATGAFGGIENVARDQKQLDLLAELIAQETGTSGDSGNGQNQTGEDARNVITDVAGGIGLTGAIEGATGTTPNTLDVDTGLRPPTDLATAMRRGWTRVGEGDRPGVSIWEDSNGTQYEVNG